MLVDLKSKATRSLTIQLPKELASPRFPMVAVGVRRQKQIKSQSAPVNVIVSEQFPPVLTIQPGELVEGLPSAFLDLEQIKHAIAARELVVVKSYKPVTAAPVSEPEIKSAAPVAAAATRTQRRSK